MRGYDLARALAIVGMVAINFQVFLLAPPSAGEAILPRWLAHLPSGRSSSLFVTLAGAGIAAMSHGASGWAVRWTLVRRALFLLVAGSLLITVWSIDILHFYAFYLLLSALLLVRAPRFLLLLVAAIAIALAAAGAVLWPEMPRPEYFRPLGFVLDVIGFGIHPVIPWIAFVAVGLWIGQHDVRDPDTRASLALRGAALALGAPLVSALLEQLAVRGVLPPAALRLLGTDWSPAPLFVLGASGSAMFLVAFSQEVVSRAGDAWLVRALVSTGQLSLSIYILHALVGVGVPRWALGWEDAMSLPSVALWWALFCAMVVPLAFLWRRRFTRGPIEAVMRFAGGRTPPKIEPVTLRRLAAPRRLAWALLALGATLVMALWTLGPTARLGCEDATPLSRGARAGDLSLACPRRGYVLSLDHAREVTLSTLSGRDLYLEVYRDGALVLEDDDSGVDLDARIHGTLAPGRYRVVVRPYGSALGTFLLTLE